MSDRVARSSHAVPLPERIESLRRSRLVLGLVSVLCGLGIAASGVTLVRAADDAGVFDFFRSPGLSRFVDPIRLRPRYDYEPRLIYRPPGELKRREARRRESKRLRESRRGEMRRASTKAPKALADARQPRPSADEPARGPVPRRARLELAAMASSAGRRTMCVRTCDGYLFPVGTLHSRGDLQTHHTACSAACPGAETRLYTMAPGQSLEDPSGARSVLDGTVYARLKTAFLFRKKIVASCDCQTPGRMASHLPILLDPTLRRGDIVVDRDGEAKAFAGSLGLPHTRYAFGDYEASHDLSRGAKAQVDKVMGTTVRRKIARAWENSQRPRLAAAMESAPRPVPAAFREVAPPSGSGAGVRAFTISQQGGTRHASGAQIITIQ
jgi:hypothetical protein